MQTEKKVWEDGPYKLEQLDIDCYLVILAVEASGFSDDLCAQLMIKLQKHVHALNSYEDAANRVTMWRNTLIQPKEDAPIISAEKVIASLANSDGAWIDVDSCLHPREEKLSPVRYQLFYNVTVPYKEHFITIDAVVIETKSASRGDVTIHAIGVHSSPTNPIPSEMLDYQHFADYIWIATSEKVDAIRHAAEYIGWGLLTIDTDCNIQPISPSTNAAPDMRMELIKACMIKGLTPLAGE